MITHRVIQGDVLDGLRTLPDGCVQCCVTSPPYFNLRNYQTGKWEGGDPTCEHESDGRYYTERGASAASQEAFSEPGESNAKRIKKARWREKGTCIKCGAVYSDNQIGLEETPEQFIQKIVEVFREVRRVLREDGVLWLNFGDSYAGSGKGPTGYNGLQNAEKRMGFDKSDSNRGSQKCNLNGGAIPAGLKSKDLMMIPQRIALAMQADGWYLRSQIPWIKRNCMPESTTDRPTSAIEYVFLMTKSAKYFYDGEAIRVPSSESYQNDARPQGVLRQKVNKRSKYPDEGQFKKQDQTGNPTYAGFNERYNAKMAWNGTNIKGHSGLLKADGTPMCDGATRNFRNSDPFFESWQGLYSESGNPLAFIINPQSRPELHFATFPDLLAATCIKAGTSERGCCPKCGAPYQRIVETSGGTTGKSWHPHADDETAGQIGGMPTKGYKRESKGWKPGCKCGCEDIAPCVVLDPFMGSGTVAYVARELNRSSIGCELNPEYVKIIRSRLQADSQLDTGVVSYRFEQVEKQNLTGEQ